MHMRLEHASSVTAAPSTRSARGQRSTLLCHLLKAPVTTNHGHQLSPNRKPRQAAFLVPHTQSGCAGQLRGEAL